MAASHNHMISDLSHYLDQERYAWIVYSHDVYLVVGGTEFS